MSVFFLWKKTTWGQEPEALIKIRWDQIKGVHTLFLSAIPPLNSCYKISHPKKKKIPHQILPDWDTVFPDRNPLCPPLPGKAIKQCFSTSPSTPNYFHCFSSDHYCWSSYFRVITENKRGVVKRLRKATDKKIFSDKIWQRDAIQNTQRTLKTEQ